MRGAAARPGSAASAVGGSSPPQLAGGSRARPGSAAPAAGRSRPRQAEGGSRARPGTAPLWGVLRAWFPAGRIWPLLWLALLLSPAFAQTPADVPVAFRADPPTAEVWRLQDQGYEYLGRADGKPLFVQVQSGDLGRRPTVFRIFYRRPWEGAATVPARAHSVTMMLSAAAQHWPDQGAYQLSLLDRLLASRPLRWSLGLATLALAGLALIWRRRRLAEHERERRGQLLDSARVIGSALRPADLLAFTRSAMERTINHEVAAVLELFPEQPPRVLAAWGPGSDALSSQALREVGDFLIQTRTPLRVPRLSRSPFSPPFPQQESLLAVPMGCEGVIVGGLLLGRTQAEAFTGEDQETLAVLADQIGLALGAYRQTDQRIQQSKATAVGQLAAGVAHELNTPLGAVLLAVESAQGLLQRAPESAEKRLERAAAGVERAHRIVADLLLFSLETPERVGPVDLCQLARQRARSQSEPVREDLAATPPIQADAEQLSRAIDCLLDNAREAAAQGDGPAGVTLSTRATDTHLWLEIVDTGPGLSEAVRERCFEPFFTTKPVGHGTGLGLAVARQIITIHGGQLELTNEPGGGARAAVRLPLT